MKKKSLTNSKNVCIFVAEKEGLWHAGRLRFSTFNIANVISNSAYLMGSEGKEYDFDLDSTGKIFFVLCHFKKSGKSRKS